MTDRWLGAIQLVRVKIKKIDAHTHKTNLFAAQTAQKRNSFRKAIWKLSRIALKIVIVRWKGNERKKTVTIAGEWVHASAIDYCYDNGEQWPHIAPRTHNKSRGVMRIYEILSSEKLEYFVNVRSVYQQQHQQQ